MAQAAVRLAELVEASGTRVKLASLGPPERGVYPRWDGRIYSAARGKLGPLLAGATTVVQMGCCRRVAQTAMSVCPGASRVLVFCPVEDEISALRPEPLDATHVVVPSVRACQRLLGRAHVLWGRQAASQLSLGLSWCRWDAGMEPLDREGTTRGGGRLTLGIWTDRSLRFSGMRELLCRILQGLSDALPELDVSLLSLSPISQRLVRRISRLRLNIPVRVFRPGSLPEQMAALRRCDWLYCLCRGSSFGFPVQQSLSCGVPVIAVEADPYDELIESGLSGQLVPTFTSDGSTGFRIQDLLSTLTESLQDPETLLKMQAQRDQWGLEAARDSFCGFWSTLLQLD